MSADEAPTPARLSPKAVSYFHAHLVSDSTGETLNSALKATSTQFEGAKALVHIYALVRSRVQLDRALAEIEASPGLVMYTLMNADLRRRLEVKCMELQVPAISVLDPALNAFAEYLGVEQKLRTGAQYALDEDYFKRIAALDFTLAHDDGQLMWDLENAEVVLVGVSRTSKTPTCMYLANRGVKAANVPLIAATDPPPEVLGLKRPLVVGLTASTDRLVQIRRSRLKTLSAEAAESYSDADHIRSEIMAAKRLFARMDWPVIDVTRRSVEETAAAILTKLSARANSP